MGSPSSSEDKKDRLPGSVNALAAQSDNNSSSSSEDEDSEDESLVLEGELVRHPDAPPSSSEDDESDEEESGSVEEASGKKRNRPKNNNSQGRKKSKKQKPSEQQETLQVEFLFCDMSETYFHGLSSLLQNSSTIYQAHASELADQVIENVAIGTLIAQDKDDAVYGFASVISFTTYQQSESIQFIKKYILDHCPDNKRDELSVILSGTTKKPAGLMLHGRMINLPMELVGTLQDQLYQDLEWAKDNADENERESLKFGLFVRIAPCTQEQSSFIYRYFEDEVLAGRSQLSFACKAPTAYSREDEPMIQVLVLTRDGYKEALGDLQRMINRSS